MKRCNRCDLIFVDSVEFCKKCGSNEWLEYLPNSDKKTIPQSNDLKAENNEKCDDIKICPECQVELNSLKQPYGEKVPIIYTVDIHSFCPRCESNICQTINITCPNCYNGRFIERPSDDSSPEDLLCDNPKCHHSVRNEDYRGLADRQCPKCGADLVFKQKKSGGCYIATAVYGSYDCPQVWTLRRYRDYSLALTWYGRAFIHTYYSISPTIVEYFGNTNWFRSFWKSKLDKKVAKLNDRGFGKTPYEDKVWN